MTVVRHLVRPGISVQLLAGPVPHLLRPGLPPSTMQFCSSDDSGTL